MSAETGDGGVGSGGGVCSVGSAGDGGGIGDGGVLELDQGARYVSAETWRRLSCDASVVTMRHDAEGDIAEAGRRTRTIPAAIRRALAARDRQCRFPGCALEVCPPAPESTTPVSASLLGPPLVWDGTRFDLTWAIDILWRRNVAARLGS